MQIRRYGRHEDGSPDERRILRALAVAAAAAADSLALRTMASAVVPSPELQARDGPAVIDGTPAAQSLGCGGGRLFSPSFDAIAFAGPPSNNSREALCPVL